KALAIRKATCRCEAVPTWRVAQYISYSAVKRTVVSGVLLFKPNRIAPSYFSLLRAPSASRHARICNRKLALPPRRKPVSDVDDELARPVVVVTLPFL